MSHKINYNNTMRTRKIVFGYGINDLDENMSVHGKNTHLYNTWHSMIERCYSDKRLVKQPSYIGCTVCDEWKYLSNFKRWYDENYIEGFELDKDILVENNKVYSPETCRFVPGYLNRLFIYSKVANEELPIGVTENKPNTRNRQKTSTFRGSCNDGCGKVLSKNFKTIEEAHNWYISTKNKVIKEQAIKAFLDNSIKSDVYLSIVRRIK